MRPDTATRRLESLLDRSARGQEPDPGDGESDEQWGVKPGWTPGEPSGGRHRDEQVPGARWQVGWRTGLLFLLVVGAVVAGVGAWTTTRGAGSVVVPSATTPAATVASAPAVPTAAAPAAPTPAASATPAQLVVHVVGAVGSPGVVTLAPGARVQDALDAAGGPLPEADLRTVNLARPVQDGEQIPVPLPGETLTPAAPAPVPSASTTSATGGEGAAAPGGLVNINTASEAELDSLPGVGPVLAGRIVQWRTENGAFLTVDDLGEVSGIGDKVLSNLRPLVTV